MLTQMNTFDLLFVNIRNLHVHQCSTVSSSFERQKSTGSERDREAEFPMPIRHDLGDCSK